MEDNGVSDDEEYDLIPFDDIPISDTERMTPTELANEVELPDHDDDDDDDDDSPTLEIIDSQSLQASDGTTWSSQPSASRQVLRQNIMRQRCGPATSTQSLNIQQTFKCFMSIEMADIIVRHTNRRANNVYQSVNARNSNAEPKVWKELTVPEFYGFIGVVIMIGANRSCGENVRDLWNMKNYPLYRAAMSVNRFCAILRFIRFDDERTRATRLVNDKAAPISELWNMMNNNLAVNYKPSENLTIDEQLFPYRGRTSFTQYIPSKPAKYGIKVWWICDAKNSYPLHGQLYTGMRPQGRETSQGERVVKDLALAYKGSGRNITMDNFFTTMLLAEQLLTWNLTLVGTLRKNKTYIPMALKAHRSRQIGSSKFAFKDKLVMCSYVPKRNKVILLSTMHSDESIGTTGKPEIIEFYNKTKGAVDVMDQLFSEYTTQRQTKRWPLSLFFNLIDVTALAAYLTYHMNNEMLPKKSSQRVIFLRKLAEELCLPLMEERALNPRVIARKSSKNALDAYIQLYAPPLDMRPSTSSGRPRHAPFTGTCYLCHLQKDKISRKTRKSCCVCGKPMCLQHCVTNCMCLLCAQF